MRSFSLFISLVLFVLAACQTAQEETTTVYLVRHAEKDTSTSTDDPPLTEKGSKRAASLWQKLDVDTIHALYSTDYQRTRATLEPIAEKLNQSILMYEAHDFDGLAREIQEEHAGQTLLISGHSNTVLPIIEALGGQPPIDHIADDEYDYIFRVVIAAPQSAEVSMMEYKP